MIAAAHRGPVFALSITWCCAACTSTAPTRLYQGPEGATITMEDGRIVNLLQGSWVRIGAVDGAAASNRVYVKPGIRILELHYGVAKNVDRFAGQTFLRIDCEAGRHYRVRVLALPDGGSSGRMSFALDERSGGKVAFKFCDQAVDCQKNDPDVADRPVERH